MEQDKIDEIVNLINDILTEADPEFVQELNSIEAEHLNGKDILQVSDDDVLSAKWHERLWSQRNTKSKVFLICGGFLIGVAVPLLTMSLMGWFTPEFKPDDGFSLARFSDQTLLINTKDHKDNLFKLFPILVYTVEIPEKIYSLKPSKGINYGRFSFYIELFTPSDAATYENRIDHVSETIVIELSRTRAEDWSGVEGKEKIRAQLLKAINKSMKVRAKMIRFNNIYI